MLGVVHRVVIYMSWNEVWGVVHCVAFRMIWNESFVGCSSSCSLFV